LDKSQTVNILDPAAMTEPGLGGGAAAE